jgi:cytosine/adenosine deaminase-related metal-dependent hydrolase
VGKFPNGYEGPFPCKAKEVGNSTTAAPGDNVQPIFTLSDNTTGDTGLSGTEEDINRVTGHGEHMHMLGITPHSIDGTTDPIDAGVPSLRRTDHDIRFGESAISPMGGSEASIQLLS